MLSIKNSKGLSKNELMKINELIGGSNFVDASNDMNTSNINTSNINTSNINTSNISVNIDISFYDTYNVLSNDYVIYEMINGPIGSKISGVLGIVTTDKITMINQLHLADAYDIKLGNKLIGMIQMITKNQLLVVINKNDLNLIDFYKHINFIFCKLDDIDYNEDTEVVMMKI